MNTTLLIQRLFTLPLEPNGGIGDDRMLSDAIGQNFESWQRNERKVNAASKLCSILRVLLAVYEVGEEEAWGSALIRW